jgi:putative Holliday junction resolvase
MTISTRSITASWRESTKWNGSWSACPFTPAGLARRWGRWLASATGLPVAYADERYTSVEADNLMIQSGLKRQKRKDLRDKLAAQILLQGYLDAGCPEVESPCEPLADSEDHGP